MTASSNGPLMLFCIGAQKAGTTWVHRMLSDHPDVVFPPLKETHIFSGRFVPSLRPLLDRSIDEVRRIAERLGGETEAGQSTRRWLEQYERAAEGDDDAYRRLFRDIGGRVSGDFTPAYALLPTAGFRHVLSLFPDARILFLMRDPADRIWSQVAMDHARQPRLFGSAGQDGSPSADRLGDHATGEPRLVRSRYERTLDRLDETFPTGSVMTAFYEDVFENSAAQHRFLQDLCRHVGLDYAPSMFRDVERRVHASPALTQPAAVRMRLREITAPTVTAVRKRIGRVPDSWLIGR